MSKRLILVLALAFVAGFVVCAYAEVQNIKVGGDILLRGVARNNFDLANGAGGDKEDDQTSFATSNVRVRIDADLTDNVSATVRLLNERLWGEEVKTGRITISGTEYTLGYNKSSGIDLDLAYVTLKEFLYSPLTLMVGRQELRYGNALIVGDPDTNYEASLASPLGYNDITLDLSSRKAFDAIRAVLNYDPLILDLVYAKIKEDEVNRNDDVDLMGINLVYNLDKNTILNPYVFVRVNSETDRSDEIYVPGILISASPLENLKLSLEGAYQFGKARPIVDDVAGTVNAGTKHRAWAVQAGAEYTFADVKYTPALGLVYTYLSGDKNPNDKKNKMWDPMFEDQTPNSIPNVLFANTAAQVINVKGSIKPMEDLTLLANYGNYRLAEKPTLRVGGNLILLGYDDYVMTGKKALGNALDLAAIYDYTEDVQLGLELGWFFPGKAFDKTNGRRTANQVIGSMKVTF